MKKTVFLLLTLIACGDKDEGEYADILALDGDIAAGETLYTTNCSGCHGVDGEGVTGPAIDDHVFEHGDEHILEVVFNGEGEMPPFDLTDQEAVDILAYLHDAFE